VLGGAQIGYNWQAANWMFGFETDIQGSSLKDDKDRILDCVLNRAPQNLFLTVSQSLPWCGTTRGRVGYSFGPSLFCVASGPRY
jgi:outer membrane immunogenic protein